MFLLPRRRFTLANLPGVSSIWKDTDFSQPRQQLQGAPSVLVIGTAVDGPPNVPIAIRNVDEAKAIWGNFSGGTLIRGIEEVFIGAGSAVLDIRGLRLDGGSKATLEILETTGSTTAAQQTDADAYALLLTARQPGEIYNHVSLGYRDGQVIEIFNPKTGITSRFDYDPNRNNVQADVHNVADLVTAINSDPNLNDIVIAQYRELTAAFEMAVRYDPGSSRPNASGVYQDSTGRHSITIADRVAQWDSAYDPEGVGGSAIYANNWLNNATPSGGQTAGNNIQKVNRVYSISDIGADERLAVAGGSTATLVNQAVNMSDRSGYTSITALKDYPSATTGSLDGDLSYGPSGTTAVSEVRQVVTGLYVGTGDGTTTTFYWDAAQCIDDGDPWDDSLVHKAIASGENILTTSTTGYTGSGDNRDLVGHLIETDTREKLWDGVSVGNGGVATASGSFEAFLDTDTSGVPISGYTIAWDGAAATVTEYGSPRGNISFLTAPANGVDISVTYKSIPHTMSESTTKAAATATSTAWDKWRRYFVSGNNITFGATVPADVEVRYRKIQDFELGTQVDVIADPVGRIGTPTSSDTYSTIRFLDAGNQPGPGSTSGLVDNQDTIIGINYDFLPEFPNLTSFKSLGGGSNGNTLSASALYDQLSDTADAIENYAVDFIVPMGVNIDANKTVPNPRTGLDQTVNAGYGDLFKTLVNNLTQNVDESQIMLGVESPSATDPKTINTWVEELTLKVPGELTKSANVIADFDERLISLVAFEPVIGNKFEGTTYSANGQAIYTGLVASLDVTRASTNQPLRSTNQLRFPLSRRQLLDMIDGRLVVAKPSIGNPNEYVIVKGITAAAVGSKYQNEWATRVVRLVMNIVRAAATPFIGHANTNAAQIAMQTAINSGLKQMIGVALLGYDFKIITTPQMRAQGLLDIDLSLVLVGEISEIRTVVHIQDTV
jgi:hypothetical protein